MFRETLKRMAIIAYYYKSLTLTEQLKYDEKSCDNGLFRTSTKSEKKPSVCLWRSFISYGESADVKKANYSFHSNDSAISSISLLSLLH